LSSPSTLPPQPEKVDAGQPNKSLLDQMNSEYGILQDKLDKIGGFRTTIRGWSVTLVIASIIAAGSSKGVSPYFLGLLFIFVYAFYRMEQKQNQYGTVFGARVLHLEKRIREEMRTHIGGDDPILGFYPGIAHHLHSAMKRKSSGSISGWFTDPDRFFLHFAGCCAGDCDGVSHMDRPDLEIVRCSDCYPNGDCFRTSRQGTGCCLTHS
jgi:hypothetical protein